MGDVINITSLAASIVPKRVHQTKSATILSIVTAQELQQACGENIRAARSIIRQEDVQSNPIADSIVDLWKAQYGVN